MTPPDRPSAGEVIESLRYLQVRPVLPGIDYVTMTFHEMDVWPEYQPPPVKEPLRRERLIPVPLSDHLQMPLNPELSVLWVSADGTSAMIEYVEPEELDLAPTLSLPSDILRVGLKGNYLGDEDESIEIAGVFEEV